MDARIDPAAAFGIDLGDAHVIRNAGGSAKEALRSIVISQALLGTSEVLIVKHQGCGMLTFTNDDARAIIGQKFGAAAQEELAGVDFLPFPEIEAAVRDDVAYLQGRKSLAPGTKLSGWVYDVATGKVKQVV